MQGFQNQTHSRIEQGKVGLQFHLFLHKGPPCPESFWRLSLANIFDSGFPSSLFRSSQNMRCALQMCLISHFDYSGFSVPSATFLQ